MSAQANYYAMRSVFELQLDAQLLEGLATIGHFDGKTPSLVCATNTQRLVIHTSENPGAEAVLRSGDETRSAENPVRTLNFGRTPTALAVGRLPDTSDRKDTDALYFGAATSLLAYDVDRNREYFYREVEDGVQAVACGVVNTARGPNGTGGVPTPLTIVGGNCTINGFDASGMESLWTVTGDQVTALMLMPWDSSEAPTVSAAGSGSGSSGDAGRPLSLVAASEDFELRVFDGEDTIASIMEADKVNQLVYSGIPGRFAYLSVNGTVGVYDRTERVWRAKGKHRPVAAAFCDVDFDGVPELVVGWSNGRVEVRGDDAEKRGVLFKERHAAPVSAVLAHDYRQNGQPLPIVCTVDGVVRGLELAGEQQQEEAVHGRETFKLDMLQRERQALAAELASVEEQLDRQRKGSSDVTLPQAGTVVRHKLLPNAKSGKLDVVFSVHHGYQDTIIQGCVLHSEAVFPGREYAFFAAEEPSGTLVCAIDVPRGAEARIAAAVMIGATNAENYQLHELTFAVPKFVTYQLWNPEATEP
ncbi:putative intergrin alpha chain protein, partial [Trypanosoma grayi]|uniref:putative intergrin alpha chain protein n=1 Tax=Trypanosoma grayi TaxID=71804 RepID=UPI0004F45B56